MVVDNRGLRECNITNEPALSCKNDIVAGTKGSAIYQLGDRTVFIAEGSSVLRDIDGREIIDVAKSQRPKTAPSDHVENSLYFLRDRHLYLPDGKGNFPSAPVDWSFDSAQLLDRPSFAVGSSDTKVFFDGTWLRSFNGSYWSFLNYDLSREQDLFFAFVDRNNQLWTEQDSVELDKMVGWGDWENFDPHNIRSVWSVLPSGAEQVIFTGQGLYSFSRHVLGKQIKNGNYFFAERDGQSAFWAPVDDKALLHCIHIKSDLTCDRSFAVERVTGLAFSAKTSTLWIASDDGLLRWSKDRPEHLMPVLDTHGTSLKMASTAVALREGRVPWAIIGNMLYRQDQNGHFLPVVTHWPNALAFMPLVIRFSSKNDLWIGGVRARNGLLHLRLDGDRVVKIDQVDPALVGSELVFSLLWDTRHRLWVGTENGLAGFDGHQWIRVTKDDGLISANINQQGLSEDQDGTIWITTSRGVSHLMHPEHLFLKQNLNPVFVKVMLGERLLPEKAVSYTRDPLMITLGTLNTALASTSYYRYRLDGVDQNWITTTTGEIRYNFVPPGHSRLIVQALNDNRNLVSDPIVLEIRMERPWWSNWPLIALYILSVVGLPYTLNKLRFRYLIKRQRRLEALVEERTMEMRAAQAALEQQARQDGLTKLMNRRTAEASVKRLLEKLSRPDDLGIMQSATLALFDIDYFKSINDRFGHAIGDEILTGIGARLLQAKRQEEIIGRYGGEEFLIVMQGDFIEAKARITALLAVLSDVPFETKAGTLSIGCSAGIARTRPEEAWEDALERADQALYKAKIEGRGRIIVSERDQDDEDYPG